MYRGNGERKKKIKKKKDGKERRGMERKIKKKL